MVALNAEQPGLHLRDIGTICFVRFGRRLSHKTIKRILAETPPTQPVVRRYPVFHDLDPPTRRLAILRLHADIRGIDFHRRLT